MQLFGNFVLQMSHIKSEFDGRELTALFAEITKPHVYVSHVLGHNSIFLLHYTFPQYITLCSQNTQLWSQNINHDPVREAAALLIVTC